METTDQSEDNLHQGVVTELENLGQKSDPRSVKPVMDQPAVTHEEIKGPDHETPWQDFKEDILGRPVRVANNTGILGKVKERVTRILGKSQEAS